MSDKTRLIFMAMSGAGLGMVLGFGALMMGWVEPAVEVAGSGGVLGVGAALGLMLGALMARPWRGDAGNAEAGEEEVDGAAAQAEVAYESAAPVGPAPEREKLEDLEELKVDELEEPTKTSLEPEGQMEDHGSLFEEMEASPEVGKEGYQPSFQSVVFAMGGEEDEEEIIDMRVVEATRQAAEEARREESTTEDADPGFSALASAMGGSSAGREEEEAEENEQVVASQGASGGFGELMSSMGTKGEQVEEIKDRSMTDRMRDVGAQDRVIASGAKSNPLAGAMKGEASPKGPGEFEVVGGSEDVSTDVDALRDALNQPSEPDPLADEQEALQSDRPAASGGGLEENTSPNALRNNLLAARMRRREQRSRPKRQLLQSRQGVAGEDPDERDQTAPGYRPGSVTEGEETPMPTPERSDRSSAQDRQMTQNLKPAMNILRKPSNKEAGIDSRDGDLKVPEPEDDGRVMTVRIDNASQRELLSDAGE